jgi:hypothetical protein
VLLALSLQAWAVDVSSKQVGNEKSKIKVADLVRSAQENSAHSKLRWDKGLYVYLCEAGACLPVKMPKEIGKVDRIVPGNFLENSAGSWLALRESVAFLCSVPKNFTSRVVCGRLKAPPLPNSTIYYYQDPAHADRKALLYVPAKTSPGISNKGKLRFTKYFQSSLAETTIAVQGALNNMTRVAQTSGSTLIFDISTDTDVVPPPPTEGDHGKSSQGQPSSATQSISGGDYSTQSSGDGEFAEEGCAWVAGVYVCRVIIGPPPLVDPYEPPLPSPDLPWYCDWFGVFCPGDPEMPPPSPPPSPAPAPEPTPPISSDNGGSEPTNPPRDEELYQLARAECMRNASDATLGTPPGNDGWNWTNYYNQCMEGMGYPDH